jgi:hypothetical protein
MKSKTLVLSLLLCVALLSCKKERTCVCTTTYTYSYNGPDGSYADSEPGEVHTTSYDKVRKRDLGTICGDSEYTYNESGVTPDGPETSTSTSNTQCELK